MMRVFVYGTLMDADVRKMVLGRALSSSEILPARLRHFRRVYIAGRLYPMILPRRGETVDGLLLNGLKRDDLDRLNAFEGPDYRLQRHGVEPLPTAADDVKGLETVAAWLFRSQRAIRPSIRPWHLDVWQTREKAVFLRQAREWLASLEQAGEERAQRAGTGALDT